jgi:hypothetical protein
MSDFFRSGIVQGVLGALVVIIILGLFGWLKFKRDEKIVTGFLEDSGMTNRHACIPTHVISASTRLSEERIVKVCRKSSRIKSSREDQDLWKLSG